MPVFEQRWPTNPDVVFVQEGPSKARRAMELLDMAGPQARLVHALLDDFAYDERQRDWVFFLEDPLIVGTEAAAVHLLMEMD